MIPFSTVPKAFINFPAQHVGHSVAVADPSALLIVGPLGYTASRATELTFAFPGVQRSWIAENDGLPCGRQRR